MWALAGLGIGSLVLLLLLGLPILALILTALPLLLLLLAARLRLHRPLLGCLGRLFGRLSCLFGRLLLLGELRVPVAIAIASRRACPARRARHSRGGCGRAAAGCAGVVCEPLGGRLIVRLAVLVELAVRDKCLFLRRARPEPPSPRVGVSVHDDPLDLSDRPVVTMRHVGRRHEGDTHSDGLPLGADQHHLLIHLDPRGEAQQPRQHQLRAVADSVDRRVLDDEPLVIREQYLERLDAVPQVRLVLLRVVLVHAVHHVVHRDEVLIL
mmetsp:Transcript_71005/g.140738  ORF Transcript_71005/g.140738 Transcript_71005/m.140738 type:complete len:268 (+) Transcript_71005:310-1113(+)